MKLILFSLTLVFACLGLFVSPNTVAAETRLQHGCEIRLATNGTHWVKNDPTCGFWSDGSETRTPWPASDPDPLPPTDPVDPDPEDPVDVDPEEPSDPEDPDTPTDPVTPTDLVDPPTDDGDGKDNNGHGNGDEGDCSGSGCTDPDNPGKKPDDKPGKDKPKKP